MNLKMSVILLTYRTFLTRHLSSFRQRYVDLISFWVQLVKSVMEREFPVSLYPYLINIVKMTLEFLLQNYIVHL